MANGLKRLIDNVPCRARKNPVERVLRACICPFARRSRTRASRTQSSAHQNVTRICAHPQMGGVLAAWINMLHCTCVRTSVRVCAYAVCMAQTSAGIALFRSSCLGRITYVCLCALHAKNTINISPKALVRTQSAAEHVGFDVRHANMDAMIWWFCFFWAQPTKANTDSKAHTSRHRTPRSSYVFLAVYWAILQLQLWNDCVRTAQLCVCLLICCIKHYIIKYAWWHYECTSEQWKPSIAIRFQSSLFQKIK